MCVSLLLQCPGKSINWHQLVNSGNNTAQIPSHSLTTTFEEEKLQLEFQIPVEYLGNSTDGNVDHRYVLGTTYVIDFESFETTTRSIDQPGSCQNRDATPFAGSFNSFWRYAEDVCVFSEL